MTMASLDLATQALKDLDRLRKEQEQVIRKINLYHSRLQASPEHADNMKDDTWMKLRGYYNRAKSLAEDEASVSSQCLEHLNGLIPGQGPPNRKKPGGFMSQTDPIEKKRKRARVDDSTRLSSPTQRTTNPANSLQPGDQVAARISSDEADNHEWIVVKLTRHDREANKFEVIDEEPDDEGGNGQRKYKLNASCIIPFTKRSEASSAPDFPIGSSVLAIYPGTTALYKAAVVPPQRKKRSDDYSLEFDGDEEDGLVGLPTKIVPFHHVVQLPSGHRQGEHYATSNEL